MQLSGSELHQINLSLCPFCHIYSLHDPRELMSFSTLTFLTSIQVDFVFAMNSQVFSTTTTTILVTTTTITSYYYYYY